MSSKVIDPLIRLRNVPWTVGYKELINYFSQYGPVKFAKVHYNDNFMSTGFAFVKFKDKDTVPKVIAKRKHLIDNEGCYIESYKF